jgi:hypothetical protein
MALVDWMIRGPELVTCNCSWGCPCQFNALPTRGSCRAALAMRIDEGHFGEVRLDGLKWCAMAAWPGAIHEGHGEILPIVDDRASEAQREALLEIMSGKETVPGATFFNVFMSMIDTVHPPLFKSIDFNADVGSAMGTFAVKGVVEAKVEPIRNPTTGKQHFAKVTLPHGFEYTEAEFASSTTKGLGAIPLDWSERHAHVAMLHLTGNGPVRAT